MATNGKWIQGAVSRMREKGTIGSFRRASKNAGMSTRSFAQQTMNSDTASPSMKKKANFAINVGKR